MDCKNWIARDARHCRILRVIAKNDTIKKNMEENGCSGKAAALAAKLSNKDGIHVASRLPDLNSTGGPI